MAADTHSLTPLQRSPIRAAVLSLLASERDEVVVRIPTRNHYKAVCQTAHGVAKAVGMPRAIKTDVGHHPRGGWAVHLRMATPAEKAAADAAYEDWRARHGHVLPASDDVIDLRPGAERVGDDEIDLTGEPASISVSGLDDQPLTLDVTWGQAWAASSEIADEPEAEPEPEPNEPTIVVLPRTGEVGSYGAETADIALAIGLLLQRLVDRDA